MVKKNQILSLFAILTISLYSGCAKKKQNHELDNEKFLNENFSSYNGGVKNYSVKKVNFSVDNIGSEFWDYEELNQAEKIKYLEENYSEYKIKIEKIIPLKSSDNENSLSEKKRNEIWRLSATFYPEGTKVLNTLSQVNSEIQTHLYKSYFTEIVNFEKEYGVKIRHLLNDTEFKFELKADWLDSTLKFKDLNTLQNTVLNGYHLISEDKITSAFRIIRGKSNKSVKSISPLKSGNAFILDGFDDLATALESSQLSRKLVYSIQGLIFYPTFIFFVGSGVEGASEQHNELKIELKNLMLENYKQELEIKETITGLIRKNQHVPENLIQLSVENSKFKMNVLREIGKLIKVPDAVLFSQSADFIKKERTKLKENETSLNFKLDQVPDNIKNILLDISQINSLSEMDTKLDIFNSKSKDSLDFFTQLMNYKETQENLLKTYYETKLPGALTESGLVAMYKGMLAFEARAMLKLIHSFSVGSQPIGLGKVEFASLLGSLGDSLLAAGQAHMVLGGLVNIVYDVKEVHTIGEWIKLVNKSPVFQNKDNQDLQLTKQMMNDFYRRLRVLTGFKTVGDISLTAGQFAMLLGGPYGLKNVPLTLAGAGATILGVATKQVFEKVIETKYEFSDAEEGSEEHKIISGDYDVSNENALDRITNRIQLLHELSQKRARIRVWQKLYSELEKNPKIEIEALISKTKKKFLAGAKYKRFYLNSLDEIFPNKNLISSEDLYIRKNNLEFLTKAKELLNRVSENKRNSSESSKLLFHRYLIQHLSLLKNEIELNKINTIKAQHINLKMDLNLLSTEELASEINSIFDYSDVLGFSDELEKKLLSRIIKGEGSLFDEVMLNKAKDYVKIERVGSVSNEKSANIFAGIKSITSLYQKYYMPNFSEYINPLKIVNPKFETEGKNKEKIIYFFDRDLFLSDLENFSSLPEDKKIVLSDILKSIFTSSIDETKIKAKFGSDHRTPIKKVFDGVYKQLVRHEVLRPTIKTTLEQLELYKFTEDMLDGDGVSNQRKQFIKLTANRILNGMNGMNVGMNILYTPSRIKEILQLSNEGNHLSSGINAVEMIFDNGDLAIDLVRTKHLMQSNPKVFSNLAAAQVFLNLATAGFSIWQGVDNLIEASKVTGKIKTDLQVSGGFAFASAGVSFMTIVAMPFTSFAGPVGAVAGFSIMLGNQIYSTVRFSQDLRELGLSENSIAFYGTMRFFAPHIDISNSPEIINLQYIKNMKDNLLNNLKVYNKDYEKSNIFIKKTIYPSLNYYLPYDIAKYAYFPSSMRFPAPPPKISGGNLLQNSIHLCQTNNVYNNKSLSFKDNEFLVVNKEKLNRKNIIKEKYYTKTIRYFPYYAEGFEDRSLLCPEENKNKYVDMLSSEINVPSFVRNHSLAQLINIGLDQQINDGKSISYVNGNDGIKNLFVINNGQYIFNLKGGDRDDIFEVRRFSTKHSYLSGKEGRDSISYQFLESDHLTNKDDYYILTKQSNIQIEKDANNLKITNYAKIYNDIINEHQIVNSENYINVENIEHFVGTNKNDLYLGTAEDDFIYGNEGNDKLYGGAGKDILVGGEGIDQLYGGTGSDMYMIGMKDFMVNKDSYDIINIFDKKTLKQPFYNNDIEDKDIITTDLDRLGMYREGDDLWIVTRSSELLKKHNEKNYIKIANVKNFFQIIKLNNYNLPILSSKDGYIYQYDPSLLTSEVNWLDGVLVDHNFNLVRNDLKEIHNRIVTKKGLRMDKIPSLAKVKMAIGSSQSEIIIGNDEDNILNGVSGSDHLSGLNGNDILMASIDLTEESSILELNGGKGEDIYMISINNLNDSARKSADIRILDLPEEKNSLVHIQFTGEINDNTLKKIAFSDKGHLIFKDHEGNNLFTLLLVNFAIPNKIQISENNTIYNISRDELIRQFEYAVEAGKAAKRAGVLNLNREYHEVNSELKHIFMFKKVNS